MTTDYGGDEGAFIISSMITKGVYAINDVDEFYNPIDLQLGTNGSINLIVGSDNNIVNKPDKCLSIIDNYKEQTGIYNFQVYGSNAIALSPADANTTVYVGDAVFYSDTDYVYLTSYTKKLALMTQEIELGGSLHSLKDLKIDGEMYTGEVNITYPLNSNDLLGYAFRINSNNQTLELIKYLNASNVDDRKAQLVAYFGQGELVNDPAYNFNKYNSTGTTPVTEFETTDPNTNAGGSGGGGGYWYANGNDIHFGNYGGTAQRVGIMTENPSETLDVIGTIKGTVLTDGFTSINNGYMTGVKSVSINVGEPYSGIKFTNIAGAGTEHIWNGYASNLYGINMLPLSFFNNDMDVSDFYTGTGTVWFDDISSNIRLSTFCNDMLNFSDLTLSNCTVTENLIANDTFIETLTASNSTLSNVTMINAAATTITITDELTVPIINTTSLSVATNVDIVGKITASTTETNDITITNKATIDQLDVLNSLNANTLTAYINKLVTDEVTTRLATISGTLSVANFAVSNVTTDMIPDSDQVYDLGNPDKKWRDLYLSGNSMYLDDVVLSADDNASGGKKLNLQNASFAMDFIEFRDGTTIASTNEIVNSINEGEVFGDFTSFNVNINIARSQMELFSGSFTYSFDHNIATTGNQWKIVEFKTLETLPILSNGSGIDMSSATLVKRGGLPKNVQSSFIHGNRVVGEHVYYSQVSQTNVNEIVPLRIYDPFSKYFRNKCKTDYNMFYNNMELELGFKSTSKTMYFEKNRDYLQINSVDNLNTKTASSKYYDIEFIYYFKSPLYDIKFLLDSMNHNYLVSNDSVARLDKAYIYDEDIGSYILRVVNENYGLYPRITLQKWDNSVNNTEFSDVIYSETMGWGTPDMNTVFTRFKDNGWLLKLFELTYIYIKYGYVVGEEAIVDIDLTAEYNKLTADDLVFVNENDVLLDDGSVIENKTIVCLKKTVFEQYFVTGAITPVVEFDFSDSYTTGTSYTDRHGNTMTHNDKLHEINDNGSLTTIFDLMELYMTPNNWSSFTDLGKNFRMHYKINITHPTNVNNVNDKFKSEFVHPTGGGHTERGFVVHLFQNTLTFNGYVRYEDGNSAELLFSTSYNVQSIDSFYGTVHDWDFEFTTFDIGSDSTNTDAWGLAKIIIDGVVRNSVYITNVSNYTAQTQQDGVFLYTTDGDNGYYKMFLALGTSELYEFEMGKLI